MLARTGILEKQKKTAVAKNQFSSFVPNGRL